MPMIMIIELLLNITHYTTDFTDVHIHIYKLE